MVPDPGSLSEPDQIKPKRLFFALWPSQQERELIHKQVNPVLKVQTGRKIPLSNWHITLAFLGMQTAEQQECIEQVASGIKGLPFELELQQLGYWAKPQVVWLGPTIIPGELQQLATDLHNKLELCGYQSQHAEYKPHLSLMRKARGMPGKTELDKALLLRCDRFVLVESVSSQQGVIYHLLKEWLLQAS